MERQNKVILSQEVASAFGVSPEVALLPGGVDLKTYRSGSVVLRQLGLDEEEAGNWNAELFSGIKENGFRVARPLKAANGSWMVDGWVAEQFLAGRHATKADLPAVLEAIVHFHDSLAGIPLPDYRKREHTIWDRADDWAWGTIPDAIDPKLRSMASELEDLLRPVGLPSQLIHGDLNLNNVLIADNLPPAIIDLAPYYRPAEFALAVTAYWVGPYVGDIVILNLFKNVREFDQTLIRAGLRMMLTQKDPQQATELNEYQRANKIIKQFVTTT